MLIGQIMPVCICEWISSNLVHFVGIIFVALMKQHVLGDHLFAFQWIGVFWNVVSVFLVGGTAIISESEKSVDEEDTAGRALLGVLLVMAGAVVQAMVSLNLVLEIQKVCWRHVTHLQF